MVHLCAPRMSKALRLLSFLPFIFAPLATITPPPPRLVRQRWWLRRVYRLSFSVLWFIALKHGELTVPLTSERFYQLGTHNVMLIPRLWNVRREPYATLGASRTLTNKIEEKENTFSFKKIFIKFLTRFINIWNLMGNKWISLIIINLQTN